MIKTLLKYMLKRWFVFLIYIPARYYIWLTTLLTMFLLGGTDDESPPLISSGIVIYIIGFLILVLSVSLPMIIITIPAARKFGKEKKESSFKYFWIYQGIVTAALAVLLILPFFYYCYFS